MKDIINGLKYDTDTAYLIHETSQSWTGFLSGEWVLKQLYLTKNKRWFLYKKIDTIAFGYDTDEYIRPLSNDEAFKYMKKYCPTKIYKYFKVEEA